MSVITEGASGLASQSRLRLLLIEDSTDDALLVLDSLDSDYEVVSKCVSRRTDLRRALAEESWDVVVSDFRLPGFSGLEAFQICRELSLDIPFIIVSGVISEETAVAAMKLGVHDYINKSNLGRLGPAVTRELRDARMRRERRDAIDALHLAHQELAAFHANAPVALLVLDSDLRVEKGNEMAARMSGRDASDMLELRLSEAFDCVAADEDPEQSASCRPAFRVRCAQSRGTRSVTGCTARLRAALPRTGLDKRRTSLCSFPQLRSKSRAGIKFWSPPKTSPI